ncbi:hypothetical protein Tco_0841486 [Tanacetum coccineum]|uniref:Uncharacterized protein n=1 Tax=Tanacetum coccineum TaxID=301880 RepID=A0ABQ5AYB2_9ASTR
MSSITAQQTKLDLELVPKENRIDIGKCNGRILRGLTPREPTFQVVLDAIALTPCYPTFLITADVPEGREFDPLPSEEDTVSFLRELGYTGEINSPNDVVVDQMHQPWRTFAALINQSLSGKTSGLDKLRLSRAQIIWGEVPPKIARKFKKASPTKKDSDLVLIDEEPVTKGKRVKRSVKKSSTKPTTAIVIIETPVKTKSIGKEKVDVSRGKGIDLLSEVALAKKAHLKEVRKKSLRDFHKTHPRVPDVTEDDSTESESESWGNDEDDSNDEQESKDESNARLEEPTQIVKEVVQGEGADVEMIDAQQGNENLETTQEQVVEDAHVTISTVTKKTEVPATSSSLFRFNDRITALEKEVAKLKKDPLYTQVTTLVDEHLDTRLGETREEFMNFLSESLTARIKEQVFYQPQFTFEAASTLTEFELKKILLDKIEKSESYLMALEHQDCYDGFKKSYTLDKDFFYSYDAYSLKRGQKDKDKDEDPSAGSDRGLKKRKLSKDAEPTTGLKKKDSTSSSSKGTKSQPKSSRPAFRQLKGIRSNYAELEYDFEECYKALSEKLDWENLEGGDYPFDFSKPLPLITCGKRQRVPFEFFINNDLKYLQGRISTTTYTTSTTKTKAVKYDLLGIEDMVPNIWSHVKVAYDKGDVYLTKRILAVTHVSVMRKHGYMYLEEIVVRRADNALYRFKEVQNWLINLSRDDVAEFEIALRMFTRSLVIQKRVEDLQLGVKSYQKKINVTKPDTTRPNLRKRHPYAPYKDPQGFNYVNEYKRNRLMRSDELYKFSDGMLTRLLSSLEDITKNIYMEYLPKRRWSTLEKKRAHFMIKDINKLLKERRMI